MPGKKGPVHEQPNQSIKMHAVMVCHTGRRRHHHHTRAKVRLPPPLHPDSNTVTGSHHSDRHHPPPTKSWLYHIPPLRHVLLHAIAPLLTPASSLPLSTLMWPLPGGLGGGLVVEDRWPGACLPLVADLGGAAVVDIGDFLPRSPLADREVWSPVAQWRKEKTYHGEGKSQLHATIIAT